MSGEERSTSRERRLLQETIRDFAAALACVEGAQARIDRLRAQGFALNQEAKHLRWTSDSLDDELTAALEQYAADDAGGQP